jgi:hypothetical protein
MTIKSAVAEFTERLQALIEGHAMERARAAVLQAFGVQPARPPKSAAPAAATPVAKKARKKLPRQLCPVPGCKNPAAPVFGMVCAKHKDVARSKIRKYREARKAKKLGLKTPVRKASKKRAEKAMPIKRAPVAEAATTAMLGE